MNTSTDNKFEFAFQETDVEEESAVELEEHVEFEEDTEISDKSEVVIYTSTFQIRGKVALVPGARLTDYIVGANLFLAVADAEVRDKSGNLILNTPFLDVHRDHIEFILPADLAKFPGI